MSCLHPIREAGRPIAPVIDGIMDNDDFETQVTSYG
jgi:hypothetical protein